jgi:hypothetical protein
LKENIFKYRTLSLVKLSFIMEGKIKTFYDKQKLKQYVTTKPQFQKILKGIIHEEDEDKYTQEWMGIIKSQDMSR